MLEQKNLNTDTLSKAIDEVFKNERKMKEKLRQLPKLKASSIIVEEMEKLV